MRMTDIDGISKGKVKNFECGMVVAVADAAEAARFVAESLR
jgi:hypothetical protein